MKMQICRLTDCSLDAQTAGKASTARSYPLDLVIPRRHADQPSCLEAHLDFACYVCIGLTVRASGSSPPGVCLSGTSKWCACATLAHGNHILGRGGAGQNRRIRVGLGCRGPEVTRATTFPAYQKNNQRKKKEDIRQLWCRDETRRGRGGLDKFTATKRMARD